MSLLIAIAILLPYVGWTQKKKLGFDSYKTWTKVENGGLSKDGDYAYYTIKNKPMGANTFVLENIKSGKEIRIKNMINPVFNHNSRILYGRLPNDTLLILDLETNELTKLKNVSKFQLFKTGNRESLIYLTTQGNLKLRLGTTLVKDILTNVVDYKISPTGKSMVLVFGGENSGKVSLVNLETLKITNVFTGDNISNLMYDNSGDKLVFYSGNKKDNSIYCYVENIGKTIKLVDSLSFNRSQYELSELSPEFSLSGEELFFKVREKQNIADSLKSSHLEIWNYKDTYLQSQYSAAFTPLTHKREYIFKVQISNRKVIQLLKGNQKISLNSGNGRIGDFLIIEDATGNLDELFISKSKISYLLCDTKNGQVDTIIPSRSTQVYEIALSPSGKYIVYYDPAKRSYMSYSIASKSVTNLTVSINSNLLKFTATDTTGTYNFPAGIVGWTKNDEDIIIRSSYDLWVIDQNNIKEPINLTQNVGYINKIVFNTAISYKNNPINPTNNIILTGFNTINKEFGFYSINIKYRSDLEKLSIGPYCVNNPQNPYQCLTSDEFVVNTNKKGYLILMQSVTQAPNYFYTKDLVHFKNISNQNPNLNYNWLTSELHNYKGRDGQDYSGILYKPENFDEEKTYPVIFSFYERQSDLLNVFPKVNPEMFGISNSIMTSNEYLVFLPDMQIGPGSVGEDALNSVLSAAEHLSKYKWVDTAKMGISGHSFGGFETNYIISHSNKFKAALSGSGNSEIISMAYDIWGTTGTSKQSYYMISAPKLIESLANNYETYVKNSPLLNTKNITTPLLLTHNDSDMAVPFRQSRQLFIALRSQNKPVWLLNYKGEGHVIIQEKNKADFNRKVFDFFDTYLKNKRKPVWMSQHN